MSAAGKSTWRWHFAGEEARRELGDAPETGFAAARIVKANEFREVRTDGKFYYKIERQPGHGFAAEFRRGVALAAAGLPVVEHLACADSPAGGALVTRAVAASSAAEYLAEHPKPEPEFREALARFTRELADSAFFHGDLHLGNLLWLPERAAFMLVDVRAVRGGFAARFAKLFARHRMLRLPLEISERLPRAEVLRLLALAGVPEPERFFRREWRRESQRRLHEWPRRRRQILAGYAKFTRRDGDRLVASQWRGDPAELVPVEGGEEAFLTGFLLSLLRIPHAEFPVLEAGRLYRAGALPEREPDADALADWRERLALAGCDAPAAAYRADADGTPLVVDLRSISIPTR